MEYGVKVFNKKHSLLPPHYHKTVPPPVLRTRLICYLYEEMAPLFPLYESPYWVLERSDKYFRLKIFNNIHTDSIDRLKPFHAGRVVKPAQPPLRGRPPKKPTALISSLHLHSTLIRPDWDLWGTPVEDRFSL